MRLAVGHLRIAAGRDHLRSVCHRWNGATFELIVVYRPEPIQVEGELCRAKLAFRVGLTLPFFRRFDVTNPSLRGCCGVYSSERWTGRHPTRTEIVPPRLDLWRWA